MERIKERLLSGNGAPHTSGGKMLESLLIVTALPIIMDSGKQLKVEPLGLANYGLVVTDDPYFTPQPNPDFHCEEDIWQPMKCHVWET